MSQSRTLRLLPAPACEPPYDTTPPEPGIPSPRTGPPIGAVQGTLALDLATPPATPSPARREPKLQVVNGDREEQRKHETRARNFAQAAAEVIAGWRPARQLVGATSACVHERLARLATPPARASRTRPTVRRIRIYEPTAGVIEASAAVQHQDRTRAMALRLERAAGKWVCTAFETH